MKVEVVIVSGVHCGNARDYASERQVWSTRIGAHQGIAHPLAEVYMAVELARLATARAAELVDTGHDAAEAANIAKFTAAEAALGSREMVLNFVAQHSLGLPASY